MYKTNSTRSRKLRLTKKTLVIGTIVALFLAGGSVFAYQQITGDDTKDTATNTPAATKGEDGSNLAPATEEEKTESEQAKEAIVQQQQNPTPPDSGKLKVTPTIAEASATRLAAYITGVFEEGGTCTATFTKGTQKFTKASAGFQNASYTQCTPIALARSDFPSSGTWSVTVTYSSAKAEGTSPAATFAVN